MKLPESQLSIRLEVKVQSIQGLVKKKYRFPIGPGTSTCEKFPPLTSTAAVETDFVEADNENSMDLCRVSEHFNGPKKWEKSAKIGQNGSTE